MKQKGAKPKVIVNEEHMELNLVKKGTEEAKITKISKKEHREKKGTKGENKSKKRINWSIRRRRRKLDKR